MAHIDARSEQASTAELVYRLSEQVTTLVRDELTLARMEMMEKGRKAGKGAGLLGASGVMATYGLGALLVTAGAALALVIPVWAAALTVTVVLFAAAGAAAVIGKNQVKQAVPPAPEEAVASGRKDVDTFLAAARSGRNS
ncbi:phage holin family protein [Actinoplanes sp. L3-i22]|uniref:phage holin family protein n=1 Tax=Actinoplanes sp. L3-i22 TaxID=2836373 RepID=UPI001C7911C1|nr:phage holin family protein [Actinoplanes sp. L3-i22]BCY07599.1 membrane protein [Actinoplanes sp. L3-i22]